MFVRSKAVAALFIAITLVGANDAWHAANDDGDFLVPVAHDHGDHRERLGHAAAGASTAHCALCHWLQAFNAGWVRPSTGHLAPQTAVVRHGAVFGAPRTADLRQRSPRGPPASLLSAING